MSSLADLEAQADVVSQKRRDDLAAALQAGQDMKEAMTHIAETNPMPKVNGVLVWGAGLYSVNASPITRAEAAARIGR